MDPRTRFAGTALAAAIAVAGTSHASLTITEIFAGIPGSDPTEDWFELTNFGGSTYDTSSLFYEDESANPTLAQQILGLSGIAAGESVVVVCTGGEAAANALRAFFGLNSGIQVGWVIDGRGLGNDDTVNIYDSNLANAMLLASQGGADPDSPATKIWNPNTMMFGDYAQAGVFGAFATPYNQDGTFIDVIASPGVVPAPGALALLTIAAVGGMRRRRA